MGLFCGVESSDYGRGGGHGAAGSDGGFGLANPTLRHPASLNANLLPESSCVSTAKVVSFGLTRHHNGVCLEIRCRAFDTGARDCRNGAAASIRVRKLRPTRM